MWHAKVYPLGETPSDFQDTITSNPPLSPRPTPPPSPSLSPSSLSPASPGASPAESPAKALLPGDLPPPPPPSPAQSPKAPPPPPLPLPPSSKSSSSCRKISPCFFNLFPWCASPDDSEEQRVGGGSSGNPQAYHDPRDDDKCAETKEHVVSAHPSGAVEHPATTHLAAHPDDSDDKTRPIDSLKTQLVTDIPGSSEKPKSSSTKSKSSKSTRHGDDAADPSSTYVDRHPDGQMSQRSSEVHTGAGVPQSESARKSTATSEELFYDTTGSPVRESLSHVPSLHGDSTGKQTTMTSQRRGSSPLPTSLQTKGTGYYVTEGPAQEEPEDRDGGTGSELSPLISKTTASSKDGGPRGRLVDLVDDLVNAARSLETGEDDENDEDTTLVRRDDDIEQQ